LKDPSKDIRYLIRKLISGYTKFFSKNGVLNSDGRKLLEEMIRILVQEYPQYKRLVKKVRRNPTLENVLRIAEIFMNENEIKELILLINTGPYRYRIEMINK